jgi:hypothetical protein
MSTRYKIERNLGGQHPVRNRLERRGYVESFARHIRKGLYRKGAWRRHTNVRTGRYEDMAT